MIKALIYWIFIFSPVFVFSQSSSIIGSAAFNEYALGVCADNAGNVYFGATSFGESWIFKRDVNNAIVWSQKLHTSAATGFLSDVSYIDIIGDTIFGCGWLKTGGNTIGTTIVGSLLFKLNATTGTAYWVKSESLNNTYFSSVKYANGKYYASGSQINNAVGYNGKVMAVSSANGNIIWQTSAIGITFPGFGNDYIDDFYSSTEMVNGQMFITGRSYVNATSTNMRTILVGINDLGTIFLQKYLEFNTTTPSDYRFYGISIEYDGPDSLIVLQYGDDDCFGCTDFKAGLIKTDLNGNVSWCKEYDLSGVSVEVGRGLNVTPNGYVFYGYANFNQNNSKMFAVKTTKTGVFQMAKLINLGTGNMGHLSGPLNTGGSSNYKNGKHYIPGSYFTSNANSRDIAQIVLNDNLEDPQGCLTITPVTATTNIYPPFSNVLNLMTPINVMNFNNQPSAFQYPFISPCSANVTFTQNSNCDSSVITASVTTINNPTYTWSNGDIGNTTTAYNNDTLFVYVSNPITCCVVVDTIIPVLTSSGLSAQLPNDTTLCLNQIGSFNLTPIVPVNSGTLTYQWSNLSQNDTISVNQSGVYWVSVSNGCQTASDTINLTINPIPVLTNILTDTICHQANTNLTLTSNIPATFTWNAMNNVSVTGETTSNSNSNAIQDILLNNTANNQVVNYVVTTTAGTCSSTANIQITVIPALAAPTITASGPLTFCTGGSVTLSSNYSTGNNWSTGETSQSITVSGSSTISLYVLNNGCSSPTSSISITELNASLPTASLSGGGTFCQGQNITPVTVNFTGSGPWTLSYQINGVNQTPISTLNSSFNLGQTAGNYVLTSVVDLNCANTVNDASLIIINPIPVIDVSPLTLCAGSSGTLTSTVNLPGGTYLWSPNGETTSAINVSPSSSSSYAVVYTVNNCPSLPDTSLVSLNPLPIVSFTADTLIGCAPLTVNFTGTSNGDPNTCLWTLSNGQTFIGCNPSYTFNQPGCYDVALTSTLNGCSASVSASQYICIENNPIALFSANPNMINPDNSTVNFFNLSSGATSYLWDFGDEGQSVEVSPSHLFNVSEGDYSVTLTATSQLGCTSEYTLSVIYEEDLIFYVPNSFTPDGDQFNQVFVPIFSSGIDESSYHLSIFDRWGELIFESYDIHVGWDGTYTAKQGMVPDGIYVWKIDFKLKKNDDHREVNGHVSILK
jgi:gliding motility-associated-like protein